MNNFEEIKTENLDFYDMDDAITIDQEIDLTEEIKCSESYFDQLDEKLIINNIVAIELYNYGIGLTKDFENLLGSIYYELRSRKRIYRYMKMYSNVVKFLMFRNGIPTKDFRYELPLEKMDECISKYKIYSDRLYNYFNNMLKSEKFEHIKDIYFIFINLNALLDFGANYFDYIANIIKKQSAGEYDNVPSDIIMQNNINIRKIEDQLKVLGI